MSSVRSHRTVAVVAATAALALALAGGALAAESDTAITISERSFAAAPQDSPVDFPGVAAARAGQPLPRGYVAVARDVRLTRGGDVAYAALRMTCPKRKTWRSVAALGDVAAAVLDRRVSGKRSVLVMASPTGDQSVGETVAGTIHVLCR